MFRIDARLRAAGLAAALAVASTATQAGSLTTLWQFTGGADGASPYKGPTLSTSGTLYGAATTGAVACPDSINFAGVGCGTIWSLTGTTLTPLVTFQGAGNGASPDGNLTLAGVKLYGTTIVGGGDDLGTVFGVGTGGAGFKTIVKMTGRDGAEPDSSIRADSQGNGYTIALSGGPAYNGTLGSGSGVLFEVTSAGKYIALHPFSGGTDGGAPGRIFLDGSGNIFGATSYGGGCTVTTNGCGVVYEYTIATGQYQVLYTFTGLSDGSPPALAGLDASGNLYGVTSEGGANGQGTLFKLAKGAGGYTYGKLWDFTGGADGGTPDAPPTLQANGSIIGTTLYGGLVNGAATGLGTLWQYKAGAVTNLYTFTGGADGSYPQSTPVVDKTGAIYLTAAFGGVTPCMTTGGNLISSYGCGTVVKYVP
jgi:uncharacterized repeat protein (TIGR03803 family)